jgi:hypothetical protein
VFYEKGKQRIAFTIVARPALDKHERALIANGRRAYAWPRAGHTCIISGDVDLAMLRKAAHWQ